jgi:hypothetical protein|tara:strand:+ start:675 stop:800 length:126 start_codon:yes stop_codon:yes gene_type:complete
MDADSLFDEDTRRIPVAMLDMSGATVTVSQPVTHAFDVWTY